MSSYAPPTFQERPVHRHTAGDGYSQSNGNTGDAIKEKVGEFFGGDRRESLPMYKDKPYAYPGKRKLPWFRKRRTAGAVLMGLAVLSWWFGILSPLAWVFGGSGGEEKEKGSGKSTSWLGGKASSAVDWDARADEVRETFKVSFAGYEKYAWGYDEFHPVNKGKRNMTPKGLGWIIVDALDTMMIMNLTTELTHAREWIHNSLTYDQDHDVSTFETTIRMVGGLLSAHYLSTGLPGQMPSLADEFGEDLYIEKATDLVDRLLGAYETESGVPLSSVNLQTMKGIASHADGGASSTAEATSLQLEMKYLAKLTGEDNYWDRAEHIMKVIDENEPVDGLVPIFIYADRGVFRGENVRLGSRGDSYYEYLIKQYLQTSQQEPIYKDLWNESLAGIKKHLLTYSYPSNFTILAERPTGLKQALSPKMDHLVCFLPGTIALAATNGKPVSQARTDPSWGPEQEENMRLAAELMKTCWGMYKVTPTGLAGEITYFQTHEPPIMYTDFVADARPSSPDFPPAVAEMYGGSEVGKEDYIIKSSDSHNLQRPETIESLFYMYRITGDDMYREWGWEMFQAFLKWTRVEDGTGFTSLSNVLAVPPGMRDNMESFWLAETLKYFFLLFSSPTILPTDEVVFNTEAHPFPKFELGQLFTTGWERKAKGASSKVAEEAQKAAEGVQQVVEEKKEAVVEGVQEAAKDAAPALPNVIGEEGGQAM